MFLVVGDGKKVEFQLIMGIELGDQIDRIGVGLGR